MKLARLILVSLLLPIPARAGIAIECGGYSPAINDHVEWTMQINGREADNGEDHFKVLETKSFFVFSGTHSQIRLNKKTDRYVTYEKGKRMPVEWSRKVPGEGCEIPR